MRDFDIRTKDSAYYFALDFLNMTGEELIDNYILECEENFDIFWSKIFATIDGSDINTLKINAYHITSNYDECAEVKQFGLRNLQFVMSNDTRLSRFLKENNLHFDIDKKVLYYEGDKYNINYDYYRWRVNLLPRERSLADIARRLYYDHAVNGFLACNDLLSYGTDIHLRPEILMLLVNLFPKLEGLEKEWISQCNGYKLDFFASLEQVQRCTFDLDVKREATDPRYQLSDEQKIKYWMLYHALNREVIPEVFIYIRDDTIITPQQILSYTKLCL